MSLDFDSFKKTSKASKPLFSQEEIEATIQRYYETEELEAQEQLERIRQDLKDSGDYDEEFENED